MTDYTELVKALLSASKVSTAWEKLMRDAADAIEELQNKVVELEEQLNDAEIAADENGRKVEELQAEVDTLKRTDIKRCQECLYLGQPVGEQLLPKRGEWEQVEVIGYDGNSMNDDAVRCSACGHVEQSVYWARTYYHYCPNCGAKMEVQE